MQYFIHLQSLLDVDLVHHVVDEHNFEDRGLFYRFRQDGMWEFSAWGALRSGYHSGLVVVVVVMAVVVVEAEVEVEGVEERS